MDDTSKAVFRMAQGLSHKTGMLWVGLLYLTLQPESDEGENTK